MMLLILSLFAMCTINQVHAEPLASHAEVAIFREMKKADIEAQKRTSRTDKEAVAALALLDSELNFGALEVIPFSKLALAILIGRGYEKGVTTELKATPVEKQIMIRVAEKAVAHARGIDFKNGQIWFQNPTTTGSIDEHARILNDLMKNVKNEEPHFDYTSENATPYQNLDQIVAAIVSSYLGQPAHEMLQNAQAKSYDPFDGIVYKQFILTFHQLSAAEQNEVLQALNMHVMDLVISPEEAVILVAEAFKNLAQAKCRLREIKLERILEPLINAIPNGPQITSLDSAGSTLDQRKALRAFSDAISNPIGGLSKEEKEFCLDALFKQKGAIFQISAKILPNIKTALDAIIEVPIIDKLQNAMINMNSSEEGKKIHTCKTAIGNLTDIQRDFYYKQLIAKIRAMLPDITAKEGESAADYNVRQTQLSKRFNEQKEQLINKLIEERVTAITPPKELKSPVPVVENPAGVVDFENELDAIARGANDNNNHNFETRLKNYLANHWAKYYKPENAVVDTRPLKNALWERFNQINNGRESAIQKKRKKTALVNKILHDLLQHGSNNNPGRIDYSTIANVVNLVRSASGENKTFTNMEKIKALPNINWNEALENHVFKLNPGLRKRVDETDTDYWNRIGRYITGIYQNKIKPHIYPDNLLNDLTSNRAPILVPFAMMFSDAYDAGNAIEDGFGVFIRDVLEFDITPANLRAHTTTANLKQKIRDSYEKTHKYFMNSMEKLFGLHIVDDTLLWAFFAAPGFTLERQDLCKKMLLIFSFFDRSGDHYEDDLALIANMAGRFTHCADGKKGAIEGVSISVYNELTGNASGDFVIEEFDPYLRQNILKNFKNDAISALSDTDHAESVSIITNIKYRHQDFWNVPTQAQALYPNYNNTDYSIEGTMDNNLNTDRVVRAIFQQIYVGPHELVNAIHSYLKSVDAKKRADFIGMVCKMLVKNRPFSDLEENTVNYAELVQQRYCENIAAPGAEPDYIFTLKGIEIILFYAGYLAWNGLDNEHPLIADWNANLQWLKDNDLDTYKEIYTH